MVNREGLFSLHVEKKKKKKMPILLELVELLKAKK